MSDILTRRTISHDEAREAVQRLVDAAFRNSDKPKPRFGIPARPDYDDDLVLSAYIKQQRERDEVWGQATDLIMEYQTKARAYDAEQKLTPNN